MRAAALDARPGVTQALVYQRDGNRHRCRGLTGVPFPLPLRITRRLQDGELALLAFWGWRTDLADPLPTYRILTISGTHIEAAQLEVRQ